MLCDGSPTRTGFTLVEILVVVIILGIASMIVVPQIGSRGDLKAAAAARVVMADLIYAQNRAIAMQKWHYVKFDTSAKKYSLLDALPSTTITHPVNKGAYETFFETGSLSDTQLVAASFDSQTTVGFDELGTPYSVGSGSPVALANTGEITIGSGDFQLKVTIEPYTGEIGVE